MRKISAWKFEFERTWMYQYFIFFNKDQKNYHPWVVVIHNSEIDLLLN